MKPSYRNSIPVLTVFITVNVLAMVLGSWLYKEGFSLSFLLITNLILFLLGLAGFFIQLKALRSDNFNAFLRGIYSSLILKIFVVIISLAIYLVITHGKVNKPSLFTSLGLYIVYTLLEVRQLLKTARTKNNA
jgi:hypothetical protein